MKRKIDSFLDLIKAQRGRKKEKKFSGTLLDYLVLVRENPKIVKLSHKRLYDVIVDQGVTVRAVGEALGATAGAQN